MDENLLLRSQVQDLDIDLIELQRQVELLQMYAAQAEMSNSVLGTRFTLSGWYQEN